MGKRYNAVVPRERKSGKTFWMNVGVFFENDRDGRAFGTLYLDALPLPDADGNVKIIFFEQEDRDSRSRSDDRPSREEDDEIPF